VSIIGQLRVARLVKEGEEEETPSQVWDGTSPRHWTAAREVLNTLVDEESLAQLLGRKSYSAYLYGISNIEDSRKHASQALGHAELHEYQDLLNVLVAQLRHDRDTGSISLLPIERDPISSGPAFSWSNERFKVRGPKTLGDTCHNYI
jgi:hypothetical protein